MTLDRAVLAFAGLVVLTGLALGSGLSGGIVGLFMLYLAAVWFCMIASLW